MITTLFLLLLIGFQLWALTSQKAGGAASPVYLQMILRNRQLARLIGGAFILLATILFIVKLGWMSGTCAALVGLMGVGCLVVLLRPFRFFNAKGVVLLYAFFVVLEIIL